MVVFVCDRNATLSPMAEAIARQIAPHIEFQSAGRTDTHIHPNIHVVLQEQGIYSSNLTSKLLWAIDFDDVQYVISLVSAEYAPKIPSRYQIMYWILPDPAWDPVEERMNAFRDLRDELTSRIQIFLEKEHLM